VSLSTTARRLVVSCVLASASLWCAAAQADLPGFLRTENGEVSTGNAALEKGDAKSAITSYDRAARMLPDAPGVQLDRGLALLKQGDYGKAREALLAATAPSAPADLRADAYEDLALSFYREADGLAGQDKHAEAQKLFREAVDAGKRSLHLRPRNPNAAWNLELSSRRVREEEQKQKQQEEQDKEKKKQDEQDKQKSDDQKQDQDQNSDSSNQDQQKQDQDQDQKKPDDSQAKQDGQNDKGDKDKDKDKDKAQKPEPQKPDPKQQDKDKAQADQANKDKDKDKQEPTPEQALPHEAKQALDSLQDGEENFERYRARQRATRERRAPEKDW
jgi:Ca-activated chloride channel family protein